MDWFGYLHDIYIGIWFKRLTDGVCHLFDLYWLMEIGMAYGGLPFPGTGCLVTEVANMHYIY